MGEAVPLDILRALTPKIPTNTKTIRQNQKLLLPLHHVASLPSLPSLEIPNTRATVTQHSDGSTTVATHQSAQGAPTSLNAVQFFLQRDRSALVCTNDLGETPLHVACRTGASLDIAKLLFEKSPQSVESTNKKGMLPFQLACQNDKSSLELIFFLVQKSVFAFDNLPHSSTANKHTGTSEPKSPQRGALEPAQTPPHSSTKDTDADDVLKQQLKVLEQPLQDQETAHKKEIKAILREQEERAEKRHNELELQIKELKTQNQACCTIL